MSRAIVTSLLALTSTIDPKVRLIIQSPQAGSNQWEQVVFNPYCFEALNNIPQTEKRTRAMFSLMGKAADLLATQDQGGDLSMRSFYKAQDGTAKPRLHITIRPTTTTNTPAIDVNAELAAATEKASAAGVDFSTVPAAISGSPAAFLGWLKGQTAQKLGAQVTQAIEQPPAHTDEDQPPPM